MEERDQNQREKMQPPKTIHYANRISRNCHNILEKLEKIAYP